MLFGPVKRRKSKPEDKPKKSLARRWFENDPMVRLANSDAARVAGSARAETAKLSVPDMSGVRAGLNRAASGAIEKASKVNRAVFPSMGQAAADMPRPRVNAANFPAQGYAKRYSTKADQPARARFGDLRRSARRTRLKIPGLGGL